MFAKLVLAGNIVVVFCAFGIFAGDGIGIPKLAKARINASTLSDGINEGNRAVILENLRNHARNVHVVAFPAD